MLKKLTVLALVLACSSPVFAKDAIEKALKERAGMTATVMLRSGETLTGKVDKVGDGVVRLNELSGKEYYDALIDLDSIEAIQLRRPGEK